MNYLLPQLKKSSPYILAMFLVSAVLTGHAEGNIKLGHTKAQMCEACHGLDGRSKAPEVPNLSGQVESYIVAQLKAFKSGERKNEQMTLIVQSMSPQDILNLAAYFSAIEVTIGKIPGD